MEENTFKVILDSIIYWSGTLNAMLWSYIVIPFIIFLGVYFSIKTRFIQLRLFNHVIGLTVKKKNREVKEEDSVSSMQALLTALGGRVGGGNLAGVGIALYMGGPGALFWMILMAVLMMVVATAEVTLGQMYKVHDGAETGKRYLSGPPYYMDKGLGQKVVPIIFALCIATQMAAWNGLQASYLDTYFTKILNTDQWFNSIFLIGVLGTIIAGGARWIIKSCEKVVPVMAAFYLLLAAYVIIVNFQMIPTLIVEIFQAGLGFAPIVGGTAGWSIAAAVNNGIRRGIYSNEAGIGSMPTIGGLSHVKHPTKQGLIDSFGVFLDTVILCTATGLIILTAGVLGQESSGQGDLGGLLIQQAFDYHFGDWAGYYLIFAFFTFSSTSIIANHMIGEINLKYIARRFNVRVDLVYKVLGIGIIGYGTISSVSGIVHVADILMGLSVTIHIIALFRLRHRAYETIQDYETQIVKKGEDHRDAVFVTDRQDVSSLWRKS